jgi:hypothetical protein
MYLAIIEFDLTTGILEYVRAIVRYNWNKWV